MKLKMLVSIGGTDFSLSAGEETERFSGEEARRLIDAGYAEEVGAKMKAQPVLERTVVNTSSEKRGNVAGK